MSSDLTEFYDITRRIEEPFANLAMSESRLYAVIGGPSAGKTTLLNYLKTRLENQALQAGVGLRVIPTLIDFKQIPVSSITSVDDAMSFILEQLRDCLKQAPYNLCALLDNMFARFQQGSHKPVDTFSEAFSFMRNTAVSHLGEVKLVALMDHVDGLVELEIARDIFNCCHALLEDRRIKGFFDFILTGSDNLYDHLTEPNAIWLNDAVIIKLANFEAAETKAYLRAKTNGQLPDHISLLIYAYSGGHPFLMQYFLDELGQINAHKWDTITADMVITVAEDFPDHNAQRGLDIWRIPDRDESQMTHIAYRLLLESCPKPETLAADWPGAATPAIPHPLQVLAATFSSTAEGHQAETVAGLPPLIDKVLVELGHSLAVGSDWPARLPALHQKARGLYNLLAFSFTNLCRADFRKTLGQTNTQGFSYARALDRLIYLGAIQMTPRKNYMIQGQILLDQFQELSPKGKFSQVTSLKERIETLNQNLNILKEQEANHGGSMNAPISILNQIENTESELEQARRQLALFEAE